MSEQRRPKAVVIGVPLDLGAGRRGVDMGPSAIRVAGIHRKLEEIGLNYEDWGDVVVSNPGQRSPQNPRLKYLPEILSTCQSLREYARKAKSVGAVPVVLGGDHSLAMGSVAGVAQHYHARGQRIGLIWVDAHTDMNVPDSSPSGNIHGMPLAHILGEGQDTLRYLAGFSPMVRPENVVILGARSVDRFEREVVRRTGVTVYTMRDIDQHGMHQLMEKAIARASAGTVGFQLSFDLDGCNPDIAPGVGTPVQGGLTYRESHLICEMVAESRKMVSMDIVELNSTLDLVNRTAELAVELVASALGDTIL